MADDNPERQQEGLRLGFISLNYERHFVIPTQDWNDVKKCTACGKPAPRLVSKEAGKNTYFTVQVVSPNLKNRTAKDLGESLLRAYGCQQPDCGKVDFYFYVSSPPISQ